MTAALSISNLEVVYNHTVQALRGLSIEVPDGKVVALLGSNGAGKTTTLKAASGILPLENGRVASGRIEFFGEDIARWAPHALPRRGMAHVREGRHVFAELTVDENLVAAGNARQGRSGKALDADAVFEYFPRLRERRKQLSGYLSGGEQQMLAIARALVGLPRLILLDEPSLGLAPLVVKDIFSIIARINREQGVAMLLVEQSASWKTAASSSTDRRRRCLATPMCSASTSAAATTAKGARAFATSSTTSAASAGCHECDELRPGH